MIYVSRFIICFILLVTYGTLLPATGSTAGAATKSEKPAGTKKPKKATTTSKTKKKYSSKSNTVKRTAREEKETSIPVVHPPPESSFTVAQAGSGRVRLSRGVLSQLERGDRKLQSSNGYEVQLSIDSELQRYASNLLRKYQVPFGAIVAIDPTTGRILAMSSYSAKQPWLNDIAVSATYPAASIFKIITSAAAIETSGLSGDNVIHFRGGNYTLGLKNYRPDSKLDLREMTLGEALGKSVNPVFARVAMNHLSAETLTTYAKKFGFNSSLQTDVAVDTSLFEVPIDDYEFARTAAGFGNVTLSPIHAASLMAAVANKGLMMRPFLVDQISTGDNKILYRNTAQPLQIIAKRATSEELMSMLQATVETGTAKKHFLKVENPFLREGTIAAKTGTLSGTTPKGVYHWFVGAAPVNKPRVALATLIIDPGNAKVKSTVLAREFLEKVFSMPEYQER